MENYSLSDIRAATEGIGNSGDWGGGAWWIIILFLFAFMGNGWGNNRTFNGEAVTEAGLCNAMNFNNLENAVGRLSDQNQNEAERLGNGICNLGYEMQGNINTLGREVSAAQANLSQQLASCCCETQRGIDSINYNNAINTASINANIDAKFAALEKAGLEQRIAEQAAQIQQLQLSQQMYGVVRYPNGYTYTAGNSPFCNGGSCCANI